MKISKWPTTARKWLQTLRTVHVVYQLIMSFPLAILTDFAVQWWHGLTGVHVFSPYFWPLVAGFSLCVLIPHAIILPYVEWRKKPSQLRQNVDKAYLYIAYTLKPETPPIDQRILNRNAYPLAAQDVVDLIRPHLVAQYGNEVPDQIDIDDKGSLGEWYSFIREIRPFIH